jgi:hypothetical protein
LPAPAGGLNPNRAEKRSPIAGSGFIRQTLGR